jgi:hypothetical protein
MESSHRPAVSNWVKVTSGFTSHLAGCFPQSRQILLLLWFLPGTPVLFTSFLLSLNLDHPPLQIARFAEVIMQRKSRLAKFLWGMMVRNNNTVETIGTCLAEVKMQYRAEQEVQNFLKAIHSYPERFAQDPKLSFEDHLFTITAQGEQPHFA